MKLSELNESAYFDLNFDNGIVVYLDKSNKTFGFSDKNHAKKRGLTHTIKTKKDYDKLKKTYDINILQSDFIKLSNNYKKNTKSRKKTKDITNVDQEMSKLLAAMHRDIIQMARNKK